MPKVSIVVPVHNAAGYVAASLESLFRQSLHDIEVIAVNDASTDSSAEVLNSLAFQEPRLQVIQLEENAGVHEARAVGLQRCTAPWIGFLDADDFALPTMFEELCAAAVANDADICICGSDKVTSSGRSLGKKVFFPENALHCGDIFRKFCEIRFGTGALWNKLYRADLIKRWGTTTFRWRQDATEDTLVNIGCFLHAKKVALLKNALHQYVIHPASATQSVDNSQAFVRIFRAYAVAIDAFGALHESAAGLITTLYRKQLQYDCYAVEEANDLMPFRVEISAAVDLMMQRYPEGLALLTSPCPRKMPDFAKRCPLRYPRQTISRLRRAFSDALKKR